MEDKDFYWLEELHSERSQAWVQGQNQKTISTLQKHPHFQRYFDEAMGFHASKSALPFYSVRDGYIYYVDVTEQNPLGRWVRATLQSYSKENVEWELLLDLDELSRLEGKQWYFSSADFAPKSSLCMLSLSDRGLDKSLTREFDVEAKNFVPGGFLVPESKAFVSWLDKDTLIVGGHNEATQNHLGYTRSIGPWTRGQKLSEVQNCIEGQFPHMGVYAGDYGPLGCVIKEQFTWDKSQSFLY